MTYTIKREIGIDCGHRIMTHGSKCANLHGHRYRVIAEAAASTLHLTGEQAGMVIEFAFLKDAMMQFVDHLCDHGFIIQASDPWAERMIDQEYLHKLEEVRAGDRTYFLQEGVRGAPTKLLVVPFPPTAENLAQFFYEILDPTVSLASAGQAKLVSIELWETPNCSAYYYPKKEIPLP